MYRPRIIPVLGIDDGGVVKTRRFKKPQYIGDPINAVRILNSYRADELCIVDIRASHFGKTISKYLVKDIAEEAHMPFTVGGGIRSFDIASEYLTLGAERILFSTALWLAPDQVSKTALRYGSSSVVGCLDINKSFTGQKFIYNRGRRIPMTLEDSIKNLIDLGVGEIFLNFVYRDGTFEGYDKDLILKLSKYSSVSIVPLGGARDLRDFEWIRDVGLYSGAASSSFVFHGRENGILVNYLSEEEKNKLVRNDNI